MRDCYERHDQLNRCISGFYRILASVLYLWPCTVSGTRSSLAVDTRRQSSMPQTLRSLPCYKTKELLVLPSPASSAPDKDLCVLSRAQATCSGERQACLFAKLTSATTLSFASVADDLCFALQKSIASRRVMR